MKLHRCEFGDGNSFPPNTEWKVSKEIYLIYKSPPKKIHSNTHMKESINPNTTINLCAVIETGVEFIHLSYDFVVFHMLSSLHLPIRSIIFHIWCSSILYTHINIRLRQQSYNHVLKWTLTLALKDAHPCAIFFFVHLTQFPPASDILHISHIFVSAIFHFSTIALFASRRLHHCFTLVVPLALAVSYVRLFRCNLIGTASKSTVIYY